MSNYIFDKQSGPYDSLPSLANSKSLKLAQRTAEKQQKLFPETAGPTPEQLAKADRVLAGDGEDVGRDLIDQAESSVYQGAGRVADMYANIQQNVFGNKDYALSEGIDNLSNEAYADEKAGFTERGRYQQDIQGLAEQVDKGRWWDVIKQGAALGPGALADSAASGVELAGGAALTAAATAVGTPVAGAITGGLLLSNKAGKVVDAVDKVITLKERLRKGTKAIPSMIVKTAGRTSLLTADITEQMRQDYKAANNGNEPSAAWYGTNVPITMALNALEFGLISKAVPKFSKPAVKDMKEAVKFMSKSHSKAAAARILDASKKVFTTAGAEAGQEYLQTWHEILAPVVDGETLDSAVRSAVVALGKKENQTEAIVGAVLGFSAGGTARGIALAPGVATGTAADTAKATVKGAANVVKGTINTAGEIAKSAQNTARLKVLSDSERESIRNTHEINTAVFQEKSEELGKKITTVTEAATYQDMLNDEAVAPLVQKAQKDLNLQDSELEAPGKLKALKDRVVRNLKADRLLLKTELEAKNVTALAKKMTSNTVDATVEAAKAAIKMVPEEVVINTVKAAVAAKATVDDAVQIVKEIKSSTALGIIEMGLNGTAEEIKTLHIAAKSLDIGDLQRVKQVLSGKNTQLTENLVRVYNAKKEALGSTGQKTKDLINKKTLSPVIQDVAMNGNIGNQSFAAVSKALTTTLAGKITDKETLATVKQALAVYKTSPEYKDTNKTGKISPTNMEVLENTIARAEQRLNREVTKENIDRVVTKVGTAAAAAVDSVANTVTESTRKAKQAAIDLKNKRKLAAAEKLGEAASQKAKAEIAEETRLRKEAEKQAAIEEKENPRPSASERIKNIANDVVTGTKAAAENMKTALREEKVLGEGTLHEAMGLISTLIEKGDAAQVMLAIPNLVTRLNKAGYETAQDLNDLITQFPALAKNEDIRTLLETNFETDVLTEESTDNIETETVPENKLFQLFEKLIPGCAK